jgi:type III restriction enzyme
MKQTDPFSILLPRERWTPANTQDDLFQSAYEKLMPPLVHKVREAVAEWRDNDYKGASTTSIALLHFWFDPKYASNRGDFSFFFSQREAIESVIYLYEVAEAKDKLSLMHFDSSARVSTGMFAETWTRYMVKMATGAGKTKVLGLVLVWSYFHKLYETESPLSKNFLVIAPNIIVLDRLKKDFVGEKGNEYLKMFKAEPFLPDNGIADQNWQNDFQPTIHLQDEVKTISPQGNIFLTNIHRVFLTNTEPSIETIFFGAKPKADADTSKGLDLGKILRSDKIKDLVVLNDEAHHIHDKDLAWFQSIEDINNKLKLKTGKGLSLQTDFSATPKHNNGDIFVQTICDYPLVEAIQANVVKSPVLPDAESRAKLIMHDSNVFAEKYKDFLELGFAEWEQQYEALKNQKKPILFVMTMSTKEADEAAAFLEKTYPIMKGRVLVIHTNSSGAIPSGTGKKDEATLKKLRDDANNIDSDDSKYFAVVSVLILREGWDVRNVTTIVGLRPYGTESKILPEQTIGRGLRKMFDLKTREQLSVIGTPKFLEFVEELKKEGVEFGESAMGKGAKGKPTLIIQIDHDNPNKKIPALDIPLPLLEKRIYREYTKLDLIDIVAFKNNKVPFKIFPTTKEKKIDFMDIEEKYTHTTVLTTQDIPYRHTIAFFTTTILQNSRLVTGFDILYPKVEDFIINYLFNKKVDLDDPQTLRNLNEAFTKDVLYKTFKAAIDALTIIDRGSTKVSAYRKLIDTKPKKVEDQAKLTPKKSAFNYIIWDSGLEKAFAVACENRFADVLAFAKNTMGENGVNFKMEYQGEDGNIHDYYPDFLVRTAADTFFIVETKGIEAPDALRKKQRLAMWCADINALQTDYTYTAIYITDADWKAKDKDLKTFDDVVKIFKI